MIWIVFVVWLTDVRPLILFPGRSVSIMPRAGFEPTQNLISGFNKWEVTGGGRGRSILSPTWFFQECGIYIEGIALLISHIFPENFIEIPQVLQNIWRFSPSILTIFTDFWIFCNSFVAKKLMTSAYNRWCQQFYTFNLL